MLHLFDHSDKKKIKSHLKNIIHVANIDGKIDEAEKDLIFNLGKKFGITKEEIEALIKNDSDMAESLPYDLEERFEVLYDIMNMIKANEEIEKSELKIFRSMVLALNFDYKKIDEITNFFMIRVNKHANPEELFKEFKELIFNQ